MALLSSDLDYTLPAELIATRPVEPRDAARLLVYRRADGAVEHRAVRDLPALLEPDDLLVLNTTAVAPAAFSGRRASSGGRIEGLFLGEPQRRRWHVMLRSNGRLHVGDEIVLDSNDPAGQPALRLLERRGDGWIAELQQDASAAEVLERVGRTPLPPYIRRARGADDATADALDCAWYQTVYADFQRRGSVAAPTAGLHFTPAVLEALARRGVRRADVVLHVGPGTFKPVSAETLAEHPMHCERYEVPSATIEILREQEARSRGRLIAVGTTTVRTLETLPSPLPGGSGTISGETDLLIAPPYRFRRVDGMLTNFHLPRSTLLALVAAMVGLERLHELYRLAIAERYRFYSYGDAMLVL